MLSKLKGLLQKLVVFGYYRRWIVNLDNVVILRPQSCNICALQNDNPTDPNHSFVWESVIIKVPRIVRSYKDHVNRLWRVFLVI